MTSVRYNGGASFMRNDLKTSALKAQCIKGVTELFSGRGYTELRLPSVEFPEKLILNNDYRSMQNLFKTITGDGTVMALPEDAAEQTVNAVAAENASGRFFGTADVYSFLGGEKVNATETAVVIVGTHGHEIEAEISGLAVELARKFGIRDKMYLGSTEITQGIAETMYGTQQSRETVKEIIEGRPTDDIGLSCAQIFDGFRSVVGADADIRECLKAVAQKTDNKRSVSGIMNVFEVVNVLESNGMIADIALDPLYCGSKEYDNGFDFYIGDDKIINGSRCNCYCGNTQVTAVCMRINVDALSLKTTPETTKGNVPVLVADSMVAHQVAAEYKKRLSERGLNVEMRYKSVKEDYEKAVEQSSGGIVLFVDADGTVLHN